MARLRRQAGSGGDAARARDDALELKTHTFSDLKVGMRDVSTRLVAEADVIAFARTELTGYKVPRHVYFRTELPKTNVGKILRRALRDELRNELRRAELLADA